MLNARNLGKRYDIYRKPADALKELILRRRFHEPFWALRDVDFGLPPGQSLGIIGENGAGKSTLLKLAAGTLQPTCGTLERRGRVSAILELGSGFHPDLSGEENINIGCAVLGLSPQETREKFADIVEFSELGDFIYRPVKTYSSGMYVRLAFSVVSSVDPDILIVDEALAVGDQHFQKKCMDRIADFRKQGKTIVFCSHTLYFVEQVCDKCLWLKNGKPEAFGSTRQVVEDYQDYERSLDRTGPPQVLTQSGETIGEVADFVEPEPDEDGVPVCDDEDDPNSRTSSAPEEAGPADVEAGLPEPGEGDPADGGGEAIESAPNRGIGERPGAENYFVRMTLEGDITDGTIATGDELRVDVTVNLCGSGRSDHSIIVGIVRNDGVICVGINSKDTGTKLRHVAGNEYTITWVVPDLPLLAGEYEIHSVLWDANGLHAWDWCRGIARFRVRQNTDEIGLVRTTNHWSH